MHSFNVKILYNPLETGIEKEGCNFLVFLHGDLTGMHTSI